MGLMEKFREHWGVHPASHKHPAATQAIRRIPLPPRLYLLLSQHVGAPARPQVRVGQQVLKGQLIASAQGAISAPLHAPTSGRITAIDEVTAPHPSGLTAPAITIEVDDEDRWMETSCIRDPFSLPPKKSPAK